MFGNIIAIENDIVKIENTSGQIESNILNVHVAFIESNRKIIGEIIAIESKEIKVQLIGEIKDNRYTAGVIRKPSLKNSCRIITKSELELLLGKQDFQSKDTVLIGKSNLYDNYYVTANINEFLSNHFAIIGNTGTGKSCGIARIFQNIFYHNDESLPINARIVLFDVYGEYNKAFKDINKIPGLHFKNYTTDIDGEDGSNLLQIPPYFLEVDDLAILLNVTDQSQIPIIENALKLCYIFKGQEPELSDYKNDIIAKSLLDILSSGKETTQIRDQIIAVLTHYNTPTLNLDMIISQPGYSRTLRQCLNIDNQGKMNAMSLVVDALRKFTKLDLETIKIVDNFHYTLDDLYYAFEFALISEGALSSSNVFDKANALKVRLHNIINSDTKKYFSLHEVLTKEQYVKRFFMNEKNENVQIVSVNFDYIDERLAKVITKIYAKLFYNYATNLDKRASYPIHIILEEAHRYVIQDNDINIIGYNIFDRITKEGRKYGVILGLITQRPSELSPTALSQCSNFIVFRLFHPKDLEIVASISSNVSKETLEKLKTLHPGMAMVFGNAFKIPTIAKLELPNPMPESTNSDVISNWFTEE